MIADEQDMGLCGIDMADFGCQGLMGYFSDGFGHFYRWSLIFSRERSSIGLE